MSMVIKHEERSSDRFRDMGDRLLGLYVKMCLWCDSQESDGAFSRKAAIKEIGARDRDLKALLDLGEIRETAVDRFEIVHFGRYCESRAAINARREYEREKKRRLRGETGPSTTRAADGAPRPDAGTSPDAGQTPAEVEPGSGQTSARLQPDFSQNLARFDPESFKTRPDLAPATEPIVPDCSGNPGPVPAGQAPCPGGSPALPIPVPVPVPIPIPTQTQPARAREPSVGSVGSGSGINRAIGIMREHLGGERFAQVSDPVSVATKRLSELRSIADEDRDHRYAVLALACRQVRAAKEIRTSVEILLRHRCEALSVRAAFDAAIAAEVRAVAAPDTTVAEIEAKLRALDDTKAFYGNILRGEYANIARSMASARARELTTTSEPPSDLAAAVATAYDAFQNGSSHHPGVLVNLFKRCATAEGCRAQERANDPSISLFEDYDETWTRRPTPEEREILTREFGDVPSVIRLQFTSDPSVSRLDEMRGALRMRAARHDAEADEELRLLAESEAQLARICKQGAA